MRKTKKPSKLLNLTGAALFCLGSSTVGAATIYVGHGVPGEDAENALGLSAGSLDPSLPVDVKVNGGCLLEGFTLAEFAGPFTLPGGDYTVSVHPASTAAPCSGPAVIGPAVIPVPADANATILAHLAEDGGLTAGVFPNNISMAANSDVARIALHHTAAAPTVDVQVKLKRNSEVKIAVEGVSNGDSTDVDVYSRTWEVRFFPAGSKSLVYATDTMVLAAGMLNQAYAIGSLANGTFEVITNELRLRRN